MLTADMKKPPPGDEEEDEVVDLTADFTPSTAGRFSGAYKAANRTPIALPWRDQTLHMCVQFAPVTFAPEQLAVLTPLSVLCSDPPANSVKGEPGIRVKAENILGGPASYRSHGPYGMCA